MAFTLLYLPFRTCLRPCIMVTQGSRRSLEVTQAEQGLPGRM
eukprot:CAMPEP_0118636234 /NCGR_PEP_ID=MMETSP0785-20121206/2505_1 /TAXON_ID=91992 /ORGANISM="Bolidomonas pacifica, Strain CCMP 1866" /LENGTH=41 /DNA_ID= /DNA_START= /DNA_END= /DNA_ORIENTATION=